MMRQRLSVPKGRVVHRSSVAGNCDCRKKRTAATSSQHRSVHPLSLSRHRKFIGGNDNMAQAAVGRLAQGFKRWHTLWVAAVAMNRSESSFGNNCDDRKIQQTFCRSKQHRLQMIGKNHQKQQVGSGREARCTRHHRPSAHTPPATFPRRHKPVTVCKSMAPFTVSGGG